MQMLHTVTLGSRCPKAFTRAVTTGAPQHKLPRTIIANAAKTESGNSLSSLAQGAICSTLAIAASVGVLMSSQPASADMIETVSPAMMTQMAKPLPKQATDKGKIWALLVGGAAVLFVTTVASENNGDFFPAIKKANDAMKAAREAAEAREKRQAQQQQQQQRVPPAPPAAVAAAAAAAPQLAALSEEEMDSSLAAVEAGLAEARARAKAAVAEDAAAEAASTTAAAGSTAQPEHSSSEQEQQHGTPEAAPAAAVPPPALGELMSAKEELAALKDEMSARSS